MKIVKTILDSLTLVLLLVGIWLGITDWSNWIWLVFGASIVTFMISNYMIKGENN